MRVVGKFRKAPGDRKRYEVNYADWLNAGETLDTVTISGNVDDDQFYVDGWMITNGGKEVIMYVSGGVSGVSYKVTVTASTSLGQIKNDTIEFVVT